VTSLEARIRRRIFGTRWVQVFIDEVCQFDGADVVKVRRAGRGVRLWLLWETGVREYLFPACDEVRISKGD
jgi:hypothetical protein